VLLHGFGSHEGDLFSLAPALPLGPVVASVRAPLREGPGFAWFPRGASAGFEERAATANAATVALLEWLDSTESTSVGLLGFSQGGAMALQVLRHRPKLASHAVVLSGFVIDDEQPGDIELARRTPPVFWGRGSADQIIPRELIADTERWLPGHSTPTTRIYEGMPHAVSRPEIDDVAAFLREHGE